LQSPFPPGILMIGRGLQIRHRGFDSHRRLFSFSIALAGTTSPGASLAERRAIRFRATKFRRLPTVSIQKARFRPAALHGRNRAIIASGCAGCGAFQPGSGSEALDWDPDGGFHPTDGPGYADGQPLNTRKGQY
jgi:hypothetical protein